MKSKETTFWTAYALVMVILIGGSGFYLFKFHSEYKNSRTGYEGLNMQLRNLVNDEIYPSEENVEEFAATNDKFASLVESLYQRLNKYQEPLRNNIADTEFSQILRKKIDEFRDYAVKSKVLTPEEFFLGMDRYSNVPPPPQATGILNYELEAIEHILKTAIDAGAEEIYGVDREIVAEEEGEEPGDELVRKLPIQVSFLTEYNGFQKFVNDISNDEDYFLILRVVRVDNEEKVGPDKQSDRPTVTKDPEGNIIVEAEVDAEGNLISPSGEKLVVEDAAIIFGDEKLSVTAVIDLVRFPKPEGSPAAETTNS